jgi:signal transduction histidine kinase
MRNAAYARYAFRAPCYSERQVTVKLDYFKKRFLSPLVRNTLLAMLLWTGGVAGSLWWSKLTLQQQNIALAMTTARGTVNKDLAFRAWAGAHGGVYVTPDDNTPPNPYLSDIPDRDVVTNTGIRLTLINPAYMLRLVMAENALLFGSKGHLTSLQNTNPVNQPDVWEQAALESFRQDAEEATTVADIDGKPHLRMIRPIPMEQGCLKCHAHTGVRVGEVRGGISVAIPMEPLYAISRAQDRNITLFHGAAWLVGMGLIGVVALRSKWESAERGRAVQAIRELSGELTMAEERERRSLAQDLHDNLGQLLAVVKIKLATLDPGSLKSSIEEIGSLVDQADRTVRMVRQQLSPPILHSLGLGPALEWLADELKRGYGLTVHVDDDSEPKLLDEAGRTMVFRSVRELLMNVVRHAQVKRADVTCLVEDRRLIVAVSDEGCGFDVAEILRALPSAGGFGLFSIRERFASIGGGMDIDSAPGEGSTITLTVPLAAAAT